MGPRQIDFSVPHAPLVRTLPPPQPGPGHMFVIRQGIAICRNGCGTVLASREQWAALPSLTCPGPVVAEAGTGGAAACEERGQGE